MTFTSGVRDPVRVRVAPQKLHSTLDAALFQPVFYSRRISSPLFSSPPRFLTVIENLRPPFLSLSLPSFLFFSFSFSTRSWAAPRCRHLHRAAVERSPRRWIIVSFLSGSWHSSRHVSLFSWRNSFLPRLDVKRPLQEANTSGHRTLTRLSSGLKEPGN